MMRRSRPVPAPLLACAASMLRAHISPVSRCMAAQAVRACGGRRLHGEGAPDARLADARPALLEAPVRRTPFLLPSNKTAKSLLTTCAPDTTLLLPCRVRTWH